MSADRLGPLDASFLHIEDAATHMHIGSVGVFEGPVPPYADIKAMIAGKLPRVPRYRQVVRRVPGDIGRPVWVDDQDFDIDYHVRLTALPRPGSDSELRRLVGRVMSQQLDRARPLWEIWIVESVADQRWAMVSKTHHCMVDGVSGTELLAVIMDLSPAPTPAVADDWRPVQAPTSASLVAGAVLDMARSPYEQLRAVRAAGRVPLRAAGRAVDVVKGVSALLAKARPTPASSLNGPIGRSRRWAWASTTVDDVKVVRKGVGGTFNDVILTAVTAGFRQLLLSRGESVDRVVRSLVPVSVRARDARGKAVGDGRYDNRVSAMFADLPVGIADPAEELRMIRSQMADLKSSRQAVAGEVLTSISGFAPPLLLALGTRIGARTAQRSLDTITTNVPGPQIPLYVLGRRMLQAYPFVPLGNDLRTSVAIFSYDGQVSFGITGDYDRAADIEILAEGIATGMVQLLAVV